MGTESLRPAGKPRAVWRISYLEQLRKQVAPLHSLEGSRAPWLQNSVYKEPLHNLIRQHTSVVNSGTHGHHRGLAKPRQLLEMYFPDVGAKQETHPLVLRSRQTPSRAGGCSSGRVAGWSRACVHRHRFSYERTHVLQTRSTPRSPALLISDMQKLSRE